MIPFISRKIGGWFLLAGLFALAVRKELKTSPEERTWSGEVAGFVPYDFRFPTFDRFLDNWWNPDLARLLTPTTIGIGWSFNLGRIARLVGLV